MSDNATDKLKSDQINTALSLTSQKEHLHPFYDKIPFNLLKQAVYNIINDENLRNEVPVNPLYYQVISIDRIFPSDIIQEIISYNGLYLQDTKLVNKQWYKLSRSMENRIYSEFEKHEEKDAHIPYNHKINKTRIVSTKRNQLTKAENDRGYIMSPISRIPRPEHTWLMENIIDFSGSISGDRYFIYPGKYKINNPLILQEKNLTLIGIPSSSNFERVDIYFNVASDDNWDMLNSLSKMLSGIRIHQSHLRILRCHIRTPCNGIQVGTNSSLDVQQSSLTCSRWNSAIRIKDCTSKVQIEQSKIRLCRHAIQLREICQDDNEGPKLICKDNQFFNVWSYAIIHKKMIPGSFDINDPELRLDPEDYQIMSQRKSYQLENNKWAWENKRKGYPHNHNRIYYCPKINCY